MSLFPYFAEFEKILTEIYKYSLIKEEDDEIGIYNKKQSCDSSKKMKFKICVDILRLNQKQKKKK